MTRSQTPRTSSPARGWVAFVGSGPGDPGLLTVRAADLIRSADVIITEGSEHPGMVRALLDLPEGAEGGPELVDGGFGEDGQPLTHAARAKVVVRQAKRGLRVVRLMTGDPFVYASGPEEAAACAKAGLAFEIVPGVSSAAAVPASSPPATRSTGAGTPTPPPWSCSPR
jgi:uroporphyrinogen III methyltransferase/synthase